MPASPSAPEAEPTSLRSQVPGEGAVPVGDPSLCFLQCLVFQGALAGGGWEKKPKREGKPGKQNGNWKGKGVGGPRSSASHFPSPANPLPAGGCTGGRGLARVSSWGVGNRELSVSEQRGLNLQHPHP